MDFEIRFQGLEHADPLREHAEILVLAHLGRFRSELTQVSIVVGRRNSGTRPPEFRCEITATGPRLPGTTVDHRGLNAFPAIPSPAVLTRSTRAARRITVKAHSDPRCALAGR